jgi:hypothetical protein
MRGSLFRQQALDHQRPTLIGNTLAAQPLSFKMMTAFAVGLATAIVLFGCFGEYTRKARVDGYLAPADGTMAATLGDARLQARLLVPSRAIGSIHIGDAVRVRYQAFPHQQYGTFTGSITDISKTLLEPAERDGPVTATEPAYRVTVALDRQTIAIDDATWPLQAGMHLEADVPLARRRLIEWVFET